MRITMLSVVGFGLGVFLFIAASLMTRPIIDLIKPVACADGDYETWDTSVRGQNNQPRSATAIECVHADGQRTDPSPFVMGIMCLSFVLPFGAAFVVDQVVNRGK